MATSLRSGPGCSKHTDVTGKKLIGNALILRRYYVAASVKKWTIWDLKNLFCRVFLKVSKLTYFPINFFPVTCQRKKVDREKSRILTLTRLT